MTDQWKDRRVTIYTIGGVKGGIGKTTTAAFLGASLAQQHPGKVVLIDADPQSQSLYDWHWVAVTEHQERMPYPVFPWSTPDLPRRLVGLLDEYEHIVIDTGGENASMLRAALHLGAELVIPCRPNLIELRRIPATIQVATETEAATGAQVYVHMLLVCVNRRALDAASVRTFIEEQNWPLMSAAVGQSVMYPRAFGHAFADGLGDYAAVLAELDERTRV